MAGIVFYFQEWDKDVWSGRAVDLDAWRYAARAGGVEELRCINETDVVFPDWLNFECINNLTDWAEEHRNEKLVVVDTEWTCPEGAIPLSELNHSEVDWYIFGSTNPLPKLDWCQYVYLPQYGTGALHSVHIASAVMLRRWEELNKVVV